MCWGVQFIIIEPCTDPGLARRRAPRANNCSRHTPSLSHVVLLHASISTRPLRVGAIHDAAVQAAQERCPAAPAPCADVAPTRWLPGAAAASPAARAFEMRSGCGRGAIRAVWGFRSVCFACCFGGQICMPCGRAVGQVTGSLRRTRPWPEPVRLLTCIPFGRFRCLGRAARTRWQ